MPDESFDSTAYSLAHIQKVRDNIGVFVTEMLDRARRHDASKFGPEEKPGFDEAIPMLGGLSYGSPDYLAVVARMRPTLDHHYAHNSHHPEHYGNEGVAGMDLFDLVEMLCDWMAAATRNPADGVRLDYNARVFSITPQLASILANTLARWPEKSNG